MTKNIITSILLSLLLISTSAFAEPASKKSIHQLMHNTGAGNMGIQIMNQMLPALKKMVPDAPEKFWTDFMAEVNADDMVNMVIPIYQKYLTEEDVRAMNKFYSSPTGRKLIQVQPSIMHESMMLGRQWGQGIAMKVLSRYKQEVKK